MKKFKFGDKVTSYQYGYGVVAGEDRDSVYVTFSNTEYADRYYTKDGSFLLFKSGRPDLFHGHVTLEVMVTKAPVYEYQVLYTRTCDKKHRLSSDFYTSTNDFLSANSSVSPVVETKLVEETKRLKDSV